jgi:hypothetical protein
MNSPDPDERPAMLYSTSAGTFFDADVEPGMAPSETIKIGARDADLYLIRASLFTALCNEVEDAMVARDRIHDIAREIGHPLFLRTYEGSGVLITSIAPDEGWPEGRMHEWHGRLEQALEEAGFLT